MGFFSNSKDRLVESVAPGLLNNAVLKPYGRIIDLKLDSERKSIEATLELKGEPEPVRLQIREYELTKEEGKLWVLIQEVTTSKEWLTTLAQTYLVGKPIAVPPEAARVLARLL